MKIKILILIILVCLVYVPRFSYAISANLSIGSRGNDVVELQNFLIDEGYLTIPIGISKGYFGPLTQNALMNFQKINGINPAGGQLDEITRLVIILKPLIESGYFDQVDENNNNKNQETIINDQEINFNESKNNRPVKIDNENNDPINKDSQTFEVYSAQNPGEGDIGRFVINFKLSAGEDEIYVGGINYKFSNPIETGFVATDSFTGPKSKRQSNGNYKVSSNSTEIFTLTVELESSSTTPNTAQRMVLTEIMWNTDNSDSVYNRYTRNVDDYETPTLFLRGLQ